VAVLPSSKYGIPFRDSDDAFLARLGGIRGGGGRFGLRSRTLEDGVGAARRDESPETVFFARGLDGAVAGGEGVVEGALESRSGSGVFVGGRVGPNERATSAAAALAAEGRAVLSGFRLAAFFVLVAPSSLRTGALLTPVWTSTLEVSLLSVLVLRF
jgi:hypothetical protein